MKSVARRIVDRRVLHLIKMWLECPVEETNQRVRRTPTTEARDSRRGIPQGSPLSPLLANLYMRRFVLGWKKLGLEMNERLGLARARAGRDQQGRRRPSVAADAVFDRAALRRIQFAQISVAIDVSQRRVPRLFPSSAIASENP